MCGARLAGMLALPKCVYLGRASGLASRGLLFASPPNEFEGATRVGDALASCRRHAREPDAGEAGGDAGVAAGVAGGGFGEDAGDGGGEGVDAVVAGPAFARGRAGEGGDGALLDGVEHGDETVEALPAQEADEAENAGRVERRVARHGRFGDGVDEGEFGAADVVAAGDDGGDAGVRVPRAEVAQDFDVVQADAVEGGDVFGGGHGVLFKIGWKVLYREHLRGNR